MSWALADLAPNAAICAAASSAERLTRRSVPDDLEYGDSELPAIGLIKDRRTASWLIPPGVWAARGF